LSQDPESDSQEFATGGYLHILTHLYERVIVPEALAKSGNSVSRPQFEVLLYIQHHPHTRPSETARALGVSAPTMTAIIQRLEAKGLLAKVPASSDQRAVTLQLTEAGVQLLAAIEQEHTQALGTLVAGITAAQRQELVQLLKALLAAAAQTHDRRQLCLLCGNAHHPGCVLSQFPAQEYPKGADAP